MLKKSLSPNIFLPLFVFNCENVLKPVSFSNHGFGIVSIANVDICCLFGVWFFFVYVHFAQKKIRYSHLSANDISYTLALAGCISYFFSRFSFFAPLQWTRYVALERVTRYFYFILHIFF